MADRGADRSGPGDAAEVLARAFMAGCDVGYERAMSLGSIAVDMLAGSGFAVVPAADHADAERYREALAKVRMLVKEVRDERRHPRMALVQIEGEAVAALGAAPPAPTDRLSEDERAKVEAAYQLWISDGPVSMHDAMDLLHDLFCIADRLAPAPTDPEATP